jgi:catechol 2,3-dioxygenase-like lactoylglutathione lyase family enzyme
MCAMQPVEPVKGEHGQTMITHIHSTTVVVADQDKALDFYTSTLGWEKALDAPFGPEMRFLTVVPPGSKTQLVLALASWAGENLKRGGHTGISLVSGDIDGTYEELSKRGVRFKEPVQTMPWGAKATWFYDIDDNEFFLSEDQ